MTSTSSLMISRRDFARRGSSAAVLSTFPGVARLLAAKNPDRVKIGLVGCGSRGIGAVMDAVVSTPNVEICALADLFPEQIEAAVKRLRTPQKEKVRSGDSAQYGNLIIDWDRFTAVKVTPELAGHLWKESSGQGRVFHTPLGHDVQALQVPGTTTLIRRGAAWAASQPVTVSDAP